MKSKSLIGSRLGKYEIQAEIGHGGTGTVYKAYDRTLRRHVAIKVLAPILAEDPKLVEQFMSEARAAAKVQHANIVTIYEVGQQGECTYYVMEYVEGQTLEDLIQKQGAIAPDLVLSILRPVAEALDYAHQSGLVHRGVKPRNIAIGRAGRVLLTDFGIARATQGSLMSTTGAPAERPEYISPEHARDQEVGPRSDQYSLAVVAYEMLSGQLPFHGTSPLAVIYQVVHQSPRPIRELCPDLPVDVEQVLSRALAKEPEARYPSVMGFVEALGTAWRIGKRRRPTPISFAKPRRRTQRREKATSTEEPVAKSVHRRVPIWLWALAAVTLVVLGVSLFMGLTGGQAEDETPTAVAASATPLQVEPSPTRVVATPAKTLLPRPTATWTATLEPTSTRMAPPSPSPTKLASTPVSASPEPPTPAPAPMLLDPPDGESFSQPDTITLRWASVGDLPPDAFYAVTVTYTPAADPTQTWTDDPAWTQETVWVLSERDYLPSLCADGRFQWSVRVMQKTGEDDEGWPIGSPLGPASAVRTLIWAASP